MAGKHSIDGLFAQVFFSSISSPEPGPSLSLPHAAAFHAPFAKQALANVSTTRAQHSESLQPY